MREAAGNLNRSIWAQKVPIKSLYTLYTMYSTSIRLVYNQGWGGSEIHDLSSLQILPNLGTGTELSSNFSELSLTGTELDELKLWDKELRDRIFDLSGELPRP